MRPTRGRRAAMLLVAVVLAAGCGKHVHVGAPVLPPITAAPEPPPSTIAARVVASLAALAPALDDAAPDSFSTNEQCALLGIACVQAYIAREPMQFTIDQNHLRLNTLLHYQVDGTFLGLPAGSCGKPDNPRRRVRVSVEADLAWTLGWSVGLDNIRPPSVTAIDKCQITAANFDVTGKAMEAFQRGLAPLAGRANQRLQELGAQLRARLHDGWAALNRPIQVDRDLWVTVAPHEMAISPLSVSRETLDVTAALTAAPRVWVGASPPESPATDLPTLRVTPVTGDFHIAPVVSVTFSRINDELERQLKGRVYTRKLGWLPDLRVTVTGTHVTGSQNRVAIGLDLDGAVKGTLWFVGDVTYDPSQRVIKVVLVDFTVETKDQLTKVAAWLVPQILQDAITRVFNQVTVPLGTQLDDLKGKLTTALNRNYGSDVILATRLGDPTVSRPFADSISFNLQADLSGTATVTVGPNGALPTGREIRLVSVRFDTLSDDKDAEEPVDLFVESRTGTVLARRTVGVTERWGDQENQGPYSLRIPDGAGVADCRNLFLRIRKRPAGSDTGKGWNMRMTTDIVRADGRSAPGAHADAGDWGDGHPFDRRFALCDGGAP